MKKTFNINLGGTAFIIDEDAYQLLTQYFETISHVYESDDDAAELVADIEARAAELFSMRMPTPQTIITLPMAESVIEQIGRPQDFEDIKVSSDEIKVEEVEMTPPPSPYANERIQKRLFRDPENKLLGGVCSGLAAYLGVDPTWIRLATVALCFLSFSTAAFVYFILWIVIPQALTPLQRMQMVGEKPTFDNIGKTVTGMFRNDGTTPPAPNYQNVDDRSFGARLSRVFAYIAKVVLIIVGLLCFPVAFALVMAFIGFVIALIALITGSLAYVIPAGELPTDSLTFLLITGIGGTIAIGLPLIVLIWLIMTGSRKTMRPALKRTLIIIWTIGFFVAVCGAILCKIADADDRLEEAIERIDNKYEDKSGKEYEIIVEDDTTVVSGDSGNTVTEEAIEAVEAMHGTSHTVTKNGKTVTLSQDSITVTDNHGKTTTINREGVKTRKGRTK